MAEQVFWVFLVALLLCCQHGFAKNKISNIHMAVTGNLSEMAISWLTTDSTPTSVVQYGTQPNTYTLFANGTQNSYDKSAGWNHDVVVTKLNPNTTYFFIVGDASIGFSSQYSFRTIGGTGYLGTPWTVSCNGDIGTDNSQNTVNHLNSLATSGMIDLFVHMGDISYANDHPLTYESTWNKWFSMMEPALGSVPYMVGVGNHESWCRNPVCALQTMNFTTFKTKFRMAGQESGTGTNMFYSFDFQNVHFISISTESDYPGSPIDPNPIPSAVAIDTAKNSYKWEDGPGADEPSFASMDGSDAQNYFQLNWIEADLQKAVANRKNVPWIVVFGHRPIYGCETKEATSTGTPTGVAAKVQAWLEPLLLTYKVDLYLTGHVHGYCRTYPVYNSTLLSKSYVNPPGPVHIISGAGGNREGTASLSPNIAPFYGFAFGATYGYGLLTVRTALSAQLLIFPFY